MTVNCPKCPEHNEECIRRSDAHRTHVHPQGVGNHEYHVELIGDCPICPEHPEKLCIVTGTHLVHEHTMPGDNFHEYADLVNHPPHYNEGNIEVIDFIEDKELDFHLGNVVKYVCRESKGNFLEDLEKARWYLDRKITNMKEAAKTD